MAVAALVAAPHLVGCVPVAPAVATPPIVIEEPPCDPQSPTDREQPVLEAFVMPEYPRSTRGRRGTSGEVELLLFVDENGLVRETKIEAGSGWDAFDQEAVRAGRLFKFRPATVNCEPVEMWYSWSAFWERKPGN